MIDRAYVQRMARYNRWQNENLYGVADALSDEDRRRSARNGRGRYMASAFSSASTDGNRSLENPYRKSQ